MKKKIIIATAAVLVVALIVGIAAIIPKEKIDRSVIDNNKPIANEAVYVEGELAFDEEVEYALVGKKGDLELYYNAENFTLKVKNAKTGYEWDSFVDETTYIHKADKGNTENSPSVRKKLSRLFDIGYTNFDAITSNTSINENFGADVTYHKLENGFAMDIVLDVDIELTLEFWLDEDGFNVRVPVEKIKETGENGITKLTILPMFGATNDEVENGFLLFPDANGGIYNIKKVEDRQLAITSDIYFPRNFDLDDIELANEQGVKNGLMPYFGISRGDNGFIGYITEGEMNSYVIMSPTATLYDLNRIEAAICYRKTYSYIDPAGQNVTTLESNISAGDFAVHYSFATAEENEKVTYGKLAKTLREFLVKTGRLVKTESAKDENVGINLQMLMATRVESMVTEYLQAMTTCEDVEKLVNSVDEKYRSSLRVMLLGWQSSGYNLYPSTGKIANNIGSVNDLCASLNKQGIENYVVDDYILASTESKQFSKQEDSVYNETNLPVTDSTSTQYICNVYNGYKRIVNDDLPYFKKNNISGVAFDKFGWYVFDDHQKNFEMSRYDTVAAYNAIFKKVHEEGLKIANQRGNAYILSATDYIYDMPASGSSFQYIDRDIPFYQMVIHGYIPYSLDTPGNMSVDYSLEKLKWIEYGAEPTFLLTKEMSEMFKDSKVENAYATEISNWSDDVLEITEEFNTELKFTGNSTMTEHEYLTDKVCKVTYSNGSEIYINYGNEKATINDVTIEAEDYTVVNGSIEG